MRFSFLLSLLFYYGVVFGSCVQLTKEITIDEYYNTDAIFAGTVIDTILNDKRCSGSCLVALIRVEKVYRGQVSQTETVINVVYSVLLKKNRKYMFFVNKDKEFFQIGFCNRTHLFTRTENDDEFDSQSFEEYNLLYKNERKNLEKMFKIQGQTSNGFLKLRYVGDKIMCIAKIKNGRLTGAYRDYLEGGEIKSEGTFIHNKKEGLWKEGALLDSKEKVMMYSYGNYRNGKKIGEWQSFYESPQMKEYVSSDFY